MRVKVTAAYCPECGDEPFQDWVHHEIPVRPETVRFIAGGPCIGDAGMCPGRILVSSEPVSREAEGSPPTAMPSTSSLQLSARPS